MRILLNLFKEVAKVIILSEFAVVITSLSARISIEELEWFGRKSGWPIGFVDCAPYLECSYSFGGLILDIIFWTAVLYLFLYLIKRFSKSKILQSAKNIDYLEFSLLFNSALYLNVFLPDLRIRNILLYDKNLFFILLLLPVILILLIGLWLRFSHQKRGLLTLIGITISLATIILSPFLFEIFNAI